MFDFTVALVAVQTEVEQIENAKKKMGAGDSAPIFASEKRDAVKDLIDRLGPDDPITRWLEGQRNAGRN